MSGDRPSTPIAALELARAKLETVLRSDPHWRAVGSATLPANRAAHERAITEKAVYDAWRLLGEAIGQLQAIGAGERAAVGPPPARARRPRLSEALERISGEAGAAAAAGADAAPPKDDAPPAAPVTAPDIAIEESDVSFTVRAPAMPEPAPEHERATGLHEAVEAAEERIPGEDAPGAAGASSDDADGDEAEVTIVSRRS